VRLKDTRAQFFQTPLSETTFVTTHPSALLRVQEEDTREIEYRRFVGELKLVQSRLTNEPD
jgi:hypothetical protein